MKLWLIFFFEYIFYQNVDDIYYACSSFEEKGLNKDPFKLKDKTIREHTFDLTEVKKEKSSKLHEGQTIAVSEAVVEYYFHI